MELEWTSERIEAARVWLKDREWEDMEPEDFDALHPLVIVRGIQRHYAGGWVQFVSDLRS